MNNTLYYLSQTLAAIFYPMLIPSYGIGLYFWKLHTAGVVLPAAYIWVGVIGTLLFTCLLPMSVILVMIRRGNLTDIYIRMPRQRLMPYIYSTICFGFWAYFCWQVIHFPAFICWTAFGATLALLLVLLINMVWKISAHLAAFGGLFGGVMSFYLTTGTNALTMCIILLVLAFALMWARIYDESHTPMQVVAGFLLGALCTLVPNMIAM